MNKRTVLVFVSVLMLTAFAFPAVTPAPATAEGVGWEKGDEWAFGDEEDFGYVFDEVFQELKDEIDENASGFVDYDYQNAGKAGFYYKSVVLDDSNDLYTVSSSAAFYTHVFFAATLDFVELPVEGNHSDVTEGENEDGKPYWEGVDTKALKIEGEIGLDLVLKLTQTSYLTQEDLNIEALEYTFEAGLDYVFMVKNFPIIEQSDEVTENADDSETYQWMDVDYQDFSWKGKFNVDLNLDLDFEPAVNLYDLPIEEGEVWNGTTDITVSGDFGGVIDLQKPKGAPQDVLEEFYADLSESFMEENVDKSVENWGDLFPLHIPSDWMSSEELDENLTIQNNRFVLKETTIEDANYEFTTGENKTVQTPDGEITVYEIVSTDNEEDGDDDDHRRSRAEEDEAEGPNFETKLFVNPDDGRLAEMEIENEFLEEAGVELDAQPVEPQVAQQALDTKANPEQPRDGGTNEERTFDLVTEGSESSSGDDEAGYVPGFTVVTAVAVVGSVGLLRKKRRK